MDKYLKRKEPSSSTPINHIEIDDLPWDPCDRPRILQYHPNQRDEIRRQYWIMGPTQPRGHDFPKKNGRRFVKAWFDKYSNWIEYSVKSDRAFCLCCYLFRDHIGLQGGNEAFVTEGFNGWNKTERLKDHVDILLDTDKERVQREIGNGLIETGKGLNQELSFIRPGDTRWNSHYKTLLRLVEMYPSIIKVLEYVKEEGVNDIQIQEFGDCFSEASTELLNSMAALNPRDSFSMFDVSKLLRLSQFYPKDFSSLEMIELEEQLDMYHHSVRHDERFDNLVGIAYLARVMVETRKYLSYPLVYRLLKLALVLPIATATVERCFSAMKIIKSNLRNRIGEDFLNACVICAVEREALAKVKDEDVIQRFQKMRDRKGKFQCIFSPPLLLNLGSATVINHEQEETFINNKTKKQREPG
ncbi:uncharacterized protein [Rutidosis leptorrhynchoides]|uniref:uncharacterized protein n=1 Tax=Rutidosis leptorrhynchoides TaxID=125765 RepID=UPI003A98FA5C